MGIRRKPCRCSSRSEPAFNSSPSRGHGVVGNCHSRRVAERRSQIPALFAGKTHRLEQKVPQLSAATARRAEGGIEERHLRIDIPSVQLPIPAVARATLLALGWEDRGRAEKVAWHIPFDFDGHQFLLEHQKMGMNLHVWAPLDWTDEAVRALGGRALASLQRAMAITETDVFKPAIRARVAKGDVILLNNVHSFRDSYRYLRALAEEKSESAVVQRAADSDVGSKLSDFLNRSLQRAAEKTALTDAMIVAFFAYLERYLTLALPFSDADISRIDIPSFLVASWGDKFKKVLDLSSPEIKKAYDQLLHLADNYRNTRAHGHDKRGSTMGVFLEEIGAVPVMISGIEATPDFGIDHYTEERFADITTSFDDVESLIRGPVLGNAEHWIWGALDVSFAPAYVQSYRLPKDAYLEFYERESLAWERAVNMEF